MKSNKFIIEEIGLKKHESRDMLIKLINDQIKSCKVDYLAQWEKDHSITPDACNKKIEALKAKRREIEGFFEESKFESPIIDLSVSVELKVLEETRELAYA